MNGDGTIISFEISPRLMTQCPFPAIMMLRVFYSLHRH
jgi:hypothetical protein